MQITSSKIRSVAFVMPTGQRFAIRHVWSWFGYSVGVQFVILLVEVWVVFWVFTKVVAKISGAPSHIESVCVIAYASGDHHRVLQSCDLRLYFLVFGFWFYDCSLRCFVFL